MGRIEIVQGDITRLEFDALVNAANNHLWMGGGVAGALKRAGGQEIEDEAVPMGPIPVGTAVATGSGKLKARYIIHGAVMGQDLRTDADKIRQVTRSCMEKADELGIKSIAFPALGTGVGGFPLRECARIMFDEVHRYLAGKTKLKLVTFVLYDDRSYRAFENELGIIPT